MIKPKDEITKIALYKFKKFARKNMFWEEYKRLSDPLNIDKTTFIDVLNKTEPIKLIQNVDAFCRWPSKSPSFSTSSWQTLSSIWANICLSECICRDFKLAEDYANKYIYYL